MPPAKRMRFPTPIRLLLATLCAVSLAGCSGLLSEGTLGNLLPATPTPVGEPGPALLDATATPLPEETERIVFASDRGGDDEIFVINADGSGLARITSDSIRDYAPTWSPSRR